MSVPAMLHDLVGEWTGENQLRLSPTGPVRRSEATASVMLLAQGQVAAIRYTWADKGRPQDGFLTLGIDPSAGVINAFWLDSWHMADLFLKCTGVPDHDSEVAVLGSYAAAPAPDWGWRIVLAAPGGDRRKFEMRMFNISPEGDEMLAVEAAYTRREQDPR